MAKRPDVPTSVSEGLVKQRATSVAPALSPFQRFLRESRGYKKEFQDETVRSAEKKARDAVAPDGNRPRHEKEAQLGTPLSGGVLKLRLQRLCPSVHFETSNNFPDRWVAYIRKHDEVLGNTKVLIAAFPKGYMPEFSTIVCKETERFDKELGIVRKYLELADHSNPEIRGWRTVLAKFMKQRLVTQTEVEKYFGLPTHDSERWYQLVNGV